MVIYALPTLGLVSLLIWHYQALYMIIPGNPSFNSRLEQPFYDFLQLGYEHGFHGIEAVWLSVGTFYSKWIKDLASKNYVFIRSVIWIYSGNFTSLLTVTLLQFIAIERLGHPIIYEANDTVYFFQSSLLLIHWIKGSPWSFNAPVWAISAIIAPLIVSYLIFDKLKSAFAEHLFHSYPSSHGHHADI